MNLICSCGFSEEFRKTEDIQNYRQSGWITYGFNIEKNQYNFICKKCQNELPENIKKLLRIN